MTAWLVAVLAVAAFARWMWTHSDDERPPRTPAEAEQREREIIAGTRIGRSLPGERAEQAVLAEERRAQALAEQPTELYRHCQDAVRQRVGGADVVVDEGQTPPAGTLVQRTYQGVRQVGATELAPDPIIGLPLEPPLSGTYEVHGTVRKGNGGFSGSTVYDCTIEAAPPRYRVSAVTVRRAR